jgi:tetratricopeptide (TPR) repeat protein
LSATKKIIFIGTRALIALTTLAWLAIGSPSARADNAATDPAALQAKKEALFQQMLHEPANLDVTFAYAHVSAQLGDNEAAVAALERMLSFNPNLPRVDLELGVLYFRMRLVEVARTYFDLALSFNPPPEVVARINKYLTAIHAAEHSGHRISPAHPEDYDRAGITV